MPNRMRLRFIEHPNLPALAWAVHLSAGNGIANVHHGPWVETGADYFIEGAWAGDIALAEFDSSTVMGSGGKAMDDNLILVTPNHTLDRLFSCRVGGEFFASNSLPFILSLTDSSLDTRFLFYDSYMASIGSGIDRFIRKIPTAMGSEISIHYFCHLVVSSDLNIAERPKPRWPEFLNYDDYVSFLRAQISLINENATDSSRKAKFTPVATISSGYDSSACAVLACEVGCQIGLTIRESRSGIGSDSGEDIGRQLGMDVRVVDRLAYRLSRDFPEAECAGGPSEFSSFDTELASKTVFVGFHGDKVWDRVGKPSTTIVRGDVSGFGLTELRLRLGFVIMAVPFIGCTSHPSIHKISNSDEMLPWTLGKDYDRPIPRRIVESRGVPRSSFGIRKRATGVYVTEEGLENTLSPNSLLEFSEFCNTYWTRRFEYQSFLINQIKGIRRQSDRVARVLRRVSGRHIEFKLPIPRRLQELSNGYAGKHALLFHWGVSKMIDRYTRATQSYARK